jgi:hypothetical protein
MKEKEQYFSIMEGVLSRLQGFQNYPAETWKQKENFAENEVKVKGF